MQPIKLQIHDFLIFIYIIEWLNYLKINKKKMKKLISIIFILNCIINDTQSDDLQYDLLNSLQNVNNHLTDLKFIIEKLSENSLRIIDVIYLIFNTKYETTFVGDALKINSFKDFDKWFNKNLKILLEYISKWNSDYTTSTITKSTLITSSTTSTLSYKNQTSTNCIFTSSNKLTTTTYRSTTSHALSI